MAWAQDPDITLSFVDNSKRTVNSVVSLSKFSVLYAGFASYGEPNVAKQWNSPQEFLKHYGDDVVSVEKYGYAGLYASHTLQGGGEVWFCRLLPSDAKHASLVLSVHVKENNAIPVYQRNADNTFVLDDDGNKVPEMIENPDPDTVGEIPEVQKTIPGYTIKWVASENKNPTNVSSITNSDGWTIYPLMHFSALHASNAGNKYGIKITNRFSRDEDVDDGRRYSLSLYQASTTGIIESFDTTYDFAFNPDALVSKYSTLPEGLKLVYGNMDSNNGFVRREIQLDYFSKNYLALLNLLNTRFNSGSLFDIDILSCKDMNQVEYDEIILDENNLNFSESVVFLEGGSDGSLGLGNTVQTTEGPKVVDEEHIEETKNLLLKQFYTGKIDDRIEDCRKVSCGFIADCNYPTDIKKLLPTVLSVRDDIMILFDCGVTSNFEECTRMISLIKTFVDTSNFRLAIFPHCGHPVDSPANLDLKITQTYEAVYKIPQVYKNYGAFSAYAGFYQGIVDSFIPDWYVSNNTLKKRAKNLGVNYITDYGNVGGTTATGIKPLWVDADNTLYYEKNSVMRSFRNAVIACDLIRVVRHILIKHRFGKSAEANRTSAAEELNQQITSRYPDGYTFTPTFYQTERGKIEGVNNVHILYIPPDQSDKWDVVIEANRAD